MGKKKSAEKDQKVLGQIFDFIFSESKKKPSRRKPVKLTGINGQKILTDGLIAALERPGAFITEQSAKDFGDSLDVTLTKIKTDDAGVGGVKIALSKTVDIIKDPGKTFDKAVATSKAFRKSQRATYVGQFFRETMANAWARKYADLDTQIAVRLGLSTLPQSQNVDRITTRGAIGQAASMRSAPADTSDLMNRSGILAGKRIFGEREWNSLSDSTQERFLHLFSQVDKDTSKATNKKGELIFVKDWEKTFLDEFGAINGSAYFNNFKKVLVGSKGISDIGLYRSLEIGNIDSRIKSLQNLKPSAGRDEQIAVLEKARILIVGHDLAPSNVKAAMKLINQQITDINKKINTTHSASNKAKYKETLKELRDDQRTLNGLVFWGKVGEVEGYWNSYQNIYKTDLVASILNGNFFDPDQNALANPAMTESSVFDGKVKYVVPKPSDNPFINRYNDIAANIYYFTPRAWIRTIFYNGEGFAYFMYRNRKQIEGIISKELSIAAGKSVLYQMDEKTILALLSDNNSIAVQDLLSKVSKNPHLEKLLNNFIREGRLHKTFSINARLKNIIAARFEVMLKKVRSQIAKALLSNSRIRELFKGSAAKLLGQWVSKGGIRTFVTAIVKAALKALGFVTVGPFGNGFVFVTTEVLMGVVFSVGRFLFSVLVFAFLGVIAVILMGFAGTGTLLHQTFSYTNQIPGSVYENPNFTPSNPPASGNPGSPTTVYTGNAQEIFTSVKNEMGLNFSLNLVTCPGGDMCDDIGDYWCYSDPRGIFCKANEIAKQDDATLTNLFRHELVHRMQYGSGVYAEWGADYLSNNGGMYTFNTPEGPKRATETASYLLSHGCTVTELQRLALIDPAYTGTQCYSVLRSYVQSYYKK